MIGSLRGSILERTLSGELLIEVYGVGYRVFAPTSSLAQLVVGGAAFVFIHEHVREDARTLYGFLTRDERDTFEALITVNGVGPRLALAILSALAPNALRRALAGDDLDALCAVPGVGKRTAQRLLVDLKAKLDVPDLDLSGVPGETNPATTARVEVREALTSLGYSVEEARAALAEVANTDDVSVDVSVGAPVDASVEAMLKAALKHLASANK